MSRSYSAGKLSPDIMSAVLAGVIREIRETEATTTTPRPCGQRTDSFGNQIERGGRQRGLFHKHVDKPTKSVRVQANLMDEQLFLIIKVLTDTRDELKKPEMELRGSR
eukprot:TRINITY_DN10719_c0_g1_i1.p1 TRINITY_DN10719_c0_g1~~TRINITY_DN10719_c0_g1_i1.p1  ORF type:complete len:108 (+),score=14.45 TRINITY_DN10719_c0_g1_i1:153-476(+)